MKPFIRCTAIAGTLVLSGLANSADAATVTIGSELFYNGSNDAPIYSTVAPDAFIPLFTPSISGSSGGVTRSPYETNAIGADTAYSVLSPGGQPSPGSSATYNLYGATNFTILWGSPDTYNHITFYSGLLGSGNVLSTAGGSSGTDFIGSDTGCYTTTCNRFAWDLVFFSSSLPIGSVVLSNDGTAAFEYGLAPINTPLPAAVWLFGTVIAAAAGASRMRRRAKAA